MWYKCDLVCKLSHINLAMYVHLNPMMVADINQYHRKKTLNSQCGGGYGGRVYTWIII